MSLLSMTLAFTIFYAPDSRLNMCLAADTTCTGFQLIIKYHLFSFTMTPSISSQPCHHSPQQNQVTQTTSCFDAICMNAEYI